MGYRQVHLDQVKGERSVYYGKKKLALDFPNQCLSIIIDGMDQVTVFVPHSF